jgi:hypothetical protein
MKERNALARTYADRAVDALHIAVRNGFRDAKSLESDPIYEPLRSRDDFRRLVEEIDAMTETAGTSR